MLWNLLPLIYVARKLGCDRQALDTEVATAVASVTFDIPRSSRPHPGLTLYFCGLVFSSSEGVMPLNTLFYEYPKLVIDMALAYLLRFTVSVLISSLVLPRLF